MIRSTALFLFLLLINPGKGIGQEYWKLIDKVLPESYLTNKNDLYGTAVDISKGFAVVGAPGYNDFQGCVYVLSEDSSYNQIAVLTASDGEFGDEFGNAVCISDSVIVIGAFRDDDNGQNSGAVYVYVRPKTGWEDMTETFKLKASDADMSDFFGCSVAVWENTIVAGAFYKNLEGRSMGSAYVFEKAGNTHSGYEEIAKLSASDKENYDYFGYSVALDSATIVVGAFYADNGAVYVFEKPESGWTDTTETAILTAGDGASGDHFGVAVDIYDSTIVVGANMDQDRGSQSGSVYVFVKPDSGWVSMTETAKLIGSNVSSYSRFGSSVAVVKDEIVVGAYRNLGYGTNSGYVYLFKKPDAGWTSVTESAILYSTFGVSRVGSCVACCDSMIISGAFEDYTKGPDAGAACLFKKPPSGWVTSHETYKTYPQSYLSNKYDGYGNVLAMHDDMLVVGSANRIEASVQLLRIEGGEVKKVAKLSASKSTGYDHFGNSIFITDSLVIVGAKYDDGTGTYRNNVYVFEMPDSGWSDMTETARLFPSDNPAYVRFGESICANDSVIVLGADGSDENGVNSGSAYIFLKPAGGWKSMYESAKLMASDGGHYAEFGHSVSIDNRVIVVGAPGYDDNPAQSGNSRGAAYVFSQPDTGWGNATETIKLLASDGSIDDHFGQSVSIQDSIIVVGAYNDYHNYYRTGSAYVFKQSVNGWADSYEVAKLTSSDGYTDDNFGQNVYISDDKIVISAPMDDDNGSGSGSIYLFEKPLSGWETMTETIKLKPSDGMEYDNFGSSLSINNKTIVVGAKGVDDKDENCGAAYVFRLCGNTFCSINTMVCDSLVSPSGKYTWTQTGIYCDTLINALGCDSILIIHLSVNKSESTINIHACEPYTSPSGLYTWSTSGTYHDTLVNDSGCDSILTVYLSMGNPSNMTIDTVICEGQSHFAGGAEQTTSGTYYDTLLNTAGCDSVITTNLYVDVCSDQISGFNNEEIRIYPNPAKDILNIEFKYYSKLEFYNLHGELLMNTSDHTIDLRSFLPGIYFAVIIDNKGNRMKRKVIHIE
ncbi:MAG: T9SS type A sorting domain-containing protein [Bacteroidales bacterium]|nr:T9SS type A sorting domain-containing protein [Bacteroidales bacterium]